MFGEIVLALCLGLALGIVTGLVPGVHVNLVAVLLFSFLHFDGYLVAIVIIANAVTHTFLDTIPSVFLGCPEEGNCLSALPGHRLLMQGKGYYAVMLTVVGSFFGLLLSVMVLPLLLYIVEPVYSVLKDHIGVIILMLSLFLVFREKKRFWALLVFVLSGVFTLLVFNVTMNEPLFPVFSGMFGVSMLVLSSESKIPKQEEFSFSLENKVLKAVPVAVLVGWFCSFMPGMGSSQGAVLGSSIVKLCEKGFMVLVGGLSTVNMVLSLVTFYILGKARNGAVVNVMKILENVSFNQLVVFVGVAMVVGGISVYLASFLSKRFSKFIVKVNYKKLVWIVISLIVVLVFVICSWKGLVILFFSICIGLIPQLKNVSRSQMMGSLLLPVIVWLI
jgi:putative membrane protein